METIPKLITIATFLCFIACNKKDNPAPLVKSSEKSILGVVFKTEDNPVLATDVTAIINQDTIKAQFPYDVLLNGLIPTISFSGKSISPSNKTAQNFTSPLVYTITAEDGSIKKYVIACRPEQTPDTATLVYGKWNVFKDSVSNDGNFYILLDGIPNYPVPGVYFGTSADYYDFAENGKLYVSESSFSDSSAYEVLPNNTLSVADLSVYPPAEILTLTTNNAIFYWAATSPNGGKYARKLHLKK